MEISKEEFTIFTVKEHTQTELIEKKSKFIVNIYLIASKEEADKLLTQIKKQYWDARHNVYAYTLKGNISKYSDDGEPQGTAGLPVYNVISNKELENVLVIVTRYFGGILLGKGGLTRAYSNVTKKVIEEAQIYEIISTKKVKITCEYNVKDKVLFDLEKNDYKKEVYFSEKIEIIIQIPERDIDDFTKNIIKITDNKILISFLS